jgi:hypothetical protein
MFPMNNSLLKGWQQSACHFLKPARAYLTNFEKLLANWKALALYG